ncbi:MAG: fructosamine kinase family protein [Acidimicrobiales bacterium]
MSSPDELAAAVGRVVGARVTGLEPVTGGDTNRAYRMTLANGERVFVKTSGESPAGSFTVEAAGLEWLRETHTVRVPEVRAVQDTADGADPRFLVLEWVETTRRDGSCDEQLGRALAALHRFGAPGFGLDHDNVIGPLPQSNAPLPTWADFWAQRRLLPLARRAVEIGRLPADAFGVFDRLAGRIDTLAGPEEPPARLHGDLWAGNAIADRSGQPWLVDPAVYGGHREVDLAMMRLFGGIDDRCFAAYEEVHPLADGWRERVGLWQLYPLLVHAVLFGGGYGASALRVARRYL